MTLAALAVSGSPGFTDSDLAKWLAVAAFLLVVADRVGALYDRHFKQRPDPRDAYEPKGTVKALKGEIEKDMGKLEAVFQRGLGEIKTMIGQRAEEIKKLETHFEASMQGAKRSREKMHDEIGDLEERTARLEADNDTLKQQSALAALRHKHHD